MGTYCKPCLDAGHFCEASPATLNDPEPKCIFCEDGEPCPRANRVPTKLQNPAFLVDDKVNARTTQDQLTYVVPAEHKGGRHGRRPKQPVVTVHADDPAQFLDHGGRELDHRH